MTATARSRSVRPNLLFFLTDDHGRWASGAYDNREIHSPCMNWLAETGVRFDQACCVGPVCSPARATFRSGQIPSRHGVHDWLHEPNDNPAHPGLTSPGQSFLPFLRGDEIFK